MLLNFLNESVISYYLKRIGGLLLILLGIFGFILTSPISLLGGIFGLLKGIIDRKDPLESGFEGIRIASFGSINIILLGIELVRFRPNVLESGEQKKPLVKSKPTELHVEDNAPIVISKATEETKDTSPTLKPSTVSDRFFSRTELKIKAGIPQATSSHEANDSAKIQLFLVKVNQFIAQDEAQAPIKREDDSSKVKELYIETLVTLIKNPASAKNDFWDRLEQMSNKDIKLFVSKLSANKKNGKFGSTELDYLWRQFNGFEFEVSKRENKASKFAIMLEALSEEQLKASFDSPDFLNVLNKDAFADSAVNTFTRKQLELFAANSTRHETLNSMIKKLKPGPYLLGKLVSIMPYATGSIRMSLIDQISHMAHPPSFKLELTKLVDHYIQVNFQTHEKQHEASQSNTSHSIPTPHPARKWAPVPTATKPVYASSAVQRKNWSDEAFDAFIRDLNAPTFMLNAERIIADLDSLPDYRIKMLVEQAASAARYTHLLNHIWLLDAKTLNSKSNIDCRENRLKIILENITKSQLESALKENKFWEIFRNTQEPFCEMAARVLSPEQFATIICHAPLERHADFAIIIAQIKKDSPIEKERLQKILKAIIPHATPWVALVLELHVTNLLTFDKHLFEHLHNELKMSLTQSLARPDVDYNYNRDHSLDKQAISYLIAPHSHTYSATAAL
ncbi:hypothetical protein DGG96_11795 [Legionella qingyii]|uniref:Uncharacterized protein n=1 Tax=Legionella qingyii TaxID=2184757 RepID=A0A317U2J9_9GAMM|nr:hypothetical protein [Legionella qingyii]PWY55455.1 hypothetical protein DGG96_11795 [Legionella qingyii]RUR21341.1 hypothetical protein ELY20_12640 [Legionella qingyii]RUR24565.1 hypothetical protein ELY16_11475 [Legionella qingyii]